MTPVQRRNAYVFGTVCSVLTLGLLAWPVRPTQEPAPNTGSHYAGPEYAARRTAPSTIAAPLRLTSSQPVEAVPATPVIAAPTLIGLLGSRQAYLRSATSGEVERVPIGGEIDGWRVIAITGRAVTVNRPGNQQKLQLFNVDKQMPSVGSPDSPPETAG
tara:strand:- start:19271 stop:19747 length:477 start_codon:yes stop_codon:yes gene_type:complete